MGRPLFLLSEYFLFSDYLGLSTVIASIPSDPDSARRKLGRGYEVRLPNDESQSLC